MPQKYEDCSSLRPFPWPMCSVDASRTRAINDWLGCLVLMPIAYFAAAVDDTVDGVAAVVADMFGRHCSDVCCNDSAAPCLNYR